MKQTYFLAMALLGSSLAFGQNTYIETGFFAFDDTEDVLLSYETEDGINYITFGSSYSESILTSKDTITVVYSGQDVQHDFTFTDLRLKEENFRIDLYDSDVESLKTGGIDYLILDGVTYYFKKENEILIKKANDFF